MNCRKYKHTNEICSDLHNDLYCTFKLYDHIIVIIENAFFSSLMSLSNGFVLGMNRWISIFK